MFMIYIWESDWTDFSRIPGMCLFKSLTFNMMNAKNEFQPRLLYIPSKHDLRVQVDPISWGMCDNISNKSWKVTWDCHLLPAPVDGYSIPFISIWKIRKILTNRFWITCFLHPVVMHDCVSWSSWAPSANLGNLRSNNSHQPNLGVLTLDTVNQMSMFNQLEQWKKKQIDLWLLWISRFSCKNCSLGIPNNLNNWTIKLTQLWLIRHGKAN